MYGDKSSHVAFNIKTNKKHALKFTTLQCNQRLYANCQQFTQQTVTGGTALIKLLLQNTPWLVS